MYTFFNVCCSMLQCGTSVLQTNFPERGHVYTFLSVCCSVLQCVAVCCNVLQCVAVCCRPIILGELVHAYIC